MRHLLVGQRSLVLLLVLCVGVLTLGLIPLPSRHVQLRVGSKKFTESVILGEMMRILCEDTNLTAIHYREFGGTRIVFDALAAGEIDVYPDYTGTISQEILVGQKVATESEMREVLKQRGIGMSESMGFSNTYALALDRKRASELGVTAISDLRRWPELRVALTHEFLDRADGWPGLRQHYDLKQDNVVGVDHDLGYRQLISGEIDVVDVYSTDAMIRRADLVLLRDDQVYFQRYDAVWLYRLDSALKHCELQAAIQKLSGAISTDEMQTLNDEVEQGRANESQAAAQFVREHLGIEVRAQTSSWTRMIFVHLVEHLDLVRRSLLPAIVVGIAIGVWCQRYPRPGGIVLAGVGLLQTIPSLALLVLLMPLVAALGYRSVGEGSVTALTALFCYCLLPIVRNTYAGLQGIDRGAIESATVLGLSGPTRLAEIELPMALPTMLAGVRVAAVQNVGFATLGAIIGAGGLGQPILRGIRLNDLSLILAGAIPCALLAIALQLLLDGLERYLVPRGMKQRTGHS